MGSAPITSANTEDKKLDGPSFNKSTGFKKGISRYTDKYDFIFEGDDDADDDFSEEIWKFKNFPYICNIKSKETKTF